MSRDHWNVDEYRHWQRTGQEPARDDHPAVPAADLESHSVDGAKATDETQEVPARVRIVVRSRRRRLADPGGISFKAVVDGLTEGELLPDDRAKYVAEIVDVQEQSPFDETILEIWDEEP